MSGTLFVVATPIGNLEDLTFRALRTLREVDLVAAEDTRRTLKLLSHYEVRKPVISLRQHNEVRETPRLIARLVAGENVALVSDAGTPTIADPGAGLVNAAHRAGLRVVPVPGPSAVACALSVSGLSGDQFVFLGFPPPTGSARQRWLDVAAGEQRIMVIFEAPHRIKRTLADLQAAFAVTRPIVVGRELTKINETLVISDNQVNHEHRELGEFVVVVGSPSETAGHSKDASDEVARMFCYLTETASVDKNVALDLLASRFSLSTGRIENIVKKHDLFVKQHKQRSS
jgi:16S rRNA (cytidine1402-2'-O)-methyltransferase